MKINKKSPKKEETKKLRQKIFECNDLTIEEKEYLLGKIDNTNLLDVVYKLISIFGITSELINFLKELL